MVDSDDNATFSRGKSEHRQKEAKESSKRKRSKRDKAKKSSKVGERHRKRSKHGSDKADASHELLQHAAMGKTKQLRQLLDECKSLDLNICDACGASALHHACRQGHQETAALLLRRGADIDAEDFSGDTPSHLAATNGHLKLLTFLLQAEPAPHIERRNARGVSVRQLAQSVMGHRDVRSWDDGDMEELSPEDAWRQRLAEEASAGGDFGGGFDGSYNRAGVAAATEDWAEWGSWEWYGSSGDGKRSSSMQGSGLQGSAANIESEDEFAQRIWREMERRRCQQQQTTASLLNEERRQTEEKRKTAEGEAYQRSRKILEEEIFKDRAWRQAVQQGDAGSRRAQYEARWHTFVTATPGHALGMEDVPWITEGSNMKEIILYGTSGKAEEKKRFRLEQMRWHPDKFTGKFGGRLVAAERDTILARVTHISQQLNALAAN